MDPPVDEFAIKQKTQLDDDDFDDILGSIRLNILTLPPPLSPIPNRANELYAPKVTPCAGPNGSIIIPKNGSAIIPMKKKKKTKIDIKQIPIISNENKIQVDIKNELRIQNTDQIEIIQIDFLCKICRMQMNSHEDLKRHLVMVHEIKVRVCNVETSLFSKRLKR
jgi:hypothetical protein